MRARRLLVPTCTRTDRSIPNSDPIRSDPEARASSLTPVRHMHTKRAARTVHCLGIYNLNFVYCFNWIVYYYCSVFDAYLEEWSDSSELIPSPVPVLMMVHRDSGGVSVCCGGLRWAHALRPKGATGVISFDGRVRVAIESLPRAVSIKLQQIRKSELLHNAGAREQ